MAEINPPWALERLKTHTAITMRQALGALADIPGVLGATDLQVTQLPTPAMQVRVAKGQVVIPNSITPDDGPYHAFNDAPVDLVIEAADATSGRIDLVVARVHDGYYAGTTDLWSLEVVTGTPSASPVVPATPANSQVVGQILVGPGATSVTNADITDNRTNAKLRARLLHGVDLGDWEATEPGHLMTKGQVDDTVASRATLIEEIGPLGSSQASVSFSAIPQTFRALMIECATSTTDTSNSSVVLRINGDSGATDYRGYMRYETGAGTVGRVTGANNGIRVARVTPSSAGLAPFTIHLPNYSAGSTRRAAHASGGAQNGTSAADLLIFQASGWRDANAAVTSLGLTLTAGSFPAGSTFSLYGLP